MTFVYARPKTLHEWRPILTRQHGQADLQDHWESHITSRVRTAATPYTRILSALLELKWLQDGLSCPTGP